MRWGKSGRQALGSILSEVLPRALLGVLRTDFWRKCSFLKDLAPNRALIFTGACHSGGSLDWQGCPFNHNVNLSQDSSHLFTRVGKIDSQLHTTASQNPTPEVNPSVSPLRPQSSRHISYFLDVWPHEDEGEVSWVILSIQRVHFMLGRKIQLNSIFF